MVGVRVEPLVSRTRRSLATHTSQIVPPFNFSSARRLSPIERMRVCVDGVRERLTAKGLWDLFGVPPVPATGAAEDELQRLEVDLGVALPAEYRTFLARWRYLEIEDGRRVWGFGHEGVSIGSPWVSDDHRPGVRYLVFADYWAFADGDQLLFEVGADTQSVVAYLHEHGPLYEEYAPSFSLALWRMVHEPV
jgi:SMI1 / KNR4 family (SUKH-1)